MNKTFKQFPKNTVCPICKTNKNGRCTLIRIDGTARDGLCMAQPTHFKCIVDGLDLFSYNKQVGIIYIKT